MTPLDIQERNEQIALMLGWKKHNHISYHTWTNDKSIYHIYDSALQFHSDWDWLMEAVEFIESIEVDDFGYIVEMLPSSSRIYLAKNNLSIISIDPKSSRKEAVFTAVSDFAKKFNNKEL